VSKYVRSIYETPRISLRTPDTAHARLGGPPAEEQCRYMNSRNALAGYEAGGPYKLEHFTLTKGRTDLREFLWKHWHNHLKGVAEARVGTVDAGTVTALYIVQPNAKGVWGIDVELGRAVQPPPCSAFHADAIVRVPIRKPDEDYPSQTLGPYWPDRTVPKTVRMQDDEVKERQVFHHHPNGE
jgi:hypothetical protein